jgi:protein-tyrosine phosphatase
VIGPDLDANKVAPKLYVGSAPDPGRYEAFQVIVLCAKEYQPPAEAFPSSRVIHAPFDDTMAPSDDELEIAIGAALQVVRELRAGNRVLVTCRAGQNRSAFVAGLAMKRRWKLPPDKIITAIRAARHSALNNYTFEILIKRF